MKRNRLRIVFLGLLFIWCSMVFGKIIFVNLHAKDSLMTGSSWQTAYIDLQEALSVAETGDQIWVAKGTYFPSKTDASCSFQMKDNVALYGGFIGDETELTQRDWETNETVLSGNIGDYNSSSDNSKTVVQAANAILDGFTISDGTGNGAPSASDTKQSANQGMGSPPSGNEVGHMTPDALMSNGATPGTGAGLQIWQCSPVVRNCKIINNTSGKGGGVYIVGVFSGKPELSKTQETVEPLFINCIIENNTAVGRGGGISMDLGAGGLFIDCVFSGNACTDGKGGAVYNDFGCSPYFENCLFTGNFSQSGGAMANDGQSNPVISHCTFYNNEASVAGAALYQGSGPFNDPIVLNSIIWGNSCLEDEISIYNWNDCNPLVVNTIVEGGYTGEDVFDVTPYFANSKDISVTPNTDGIGYNPESVINRTENDILEIRNYFETVQKNGEPEILDLSNTSDKVEGLDDVIYVSENGTGLGDSWKTATDSLQYAIDQANLLYQETGKTISIWIAEGIYTPGQNRSDSFILREGVLIYGGFNGNETALSERDIEENETILSGDIGVKGVKTDNTYHVLIGSNLAVLDGVIISGGYADGADNGEVYDNKGGAVLNYYGGYRVRPNTTPLLGFDTTFRNCQFIDNYAEEGGAVFTYHGGNPVFESCLFLKNIANYGGATLDRGGTNSHYSNCVFQQNESIFKGAALFVDYGSLAVITNSSFLANQAGTSGGAVYVIDRASQSIPNEMEINKVDPDWEVTTDIFSSVYISGCEFKENHAEIDGGALYVYESSNAKINDTQFSDNTAGRNGDAICMINKATLYTDVKIDGIYKDETSTMK